LTATFKKQRLTVAKGHSQRFQPSDVLTEDRWGKLLLLDPAFQKQVIRVAAAGASAAREPKPCEVGYVADTEFVEHDASVLPGSKGPFWRERWTLVSCTKKN
jgi:hypothetical protein